MEWKTSRVSPLCPPPPLRIPPPSVWSQYSTSCWVCPPFIHVEERERGHHSLCLYRLCVLIPLADAVAVITLLFLTTSQYVLQVNETNHVCEFKLLPQTLPAYKQPVWHRDRRRVPHIDSLHIIWCRNKKVKESMTLSRGHATSLLTSCGDCAALQLRAGGTAKTSIDHMEREQPPFSTVWGRRRNTVR